MDKPKIQSIDHIVMQVTDFEATIRFYTEVLGMTHNEFQPPSGGLARQSLHFGEQKINLHNAGSPFVPHARVPAAGSVDLCFISGSLLADWLHHFASCGIDIEHGPVCKSGANGTISSIYIIRQ